MQMGRQLNQLGSHDLHERLEELPRENRRLAAGARDIPGEAVQGVWRVGDDGKLTGEFEENPNYGPPKDDFARLTEPDHWLGRLGERPADAVRDSIAEILDEQVPGAVLEWIKVADAPRYLTGGRPRPGDEHHMIVTRAAIALPFAPSVTAPGSRRDILQGVFSWVAVRLDQPDNRKDQVWLDLRAEMDWAEAELRNRIFLVCQAPTSDPST